MKLNYFASAESARPTSSLNGLFPDQILVPAPKVRQNSHWENGGLRYAKTAACIAFRNRRCGAGRLYFIIIGRLRHNGSNPCRAFRGLTRQTWGSAPNPGIFTPRRKTSAFIWPKISPRGAHRDFRRKAQKSCALISAQLNLASVHAVIDRFQHFVIKQA